jgi:hypothetical protein
MYSLVDFSVYNEHPLPLRFDFSITSILGMQSDDGVYTKSITVPPSSTGHLMRLSIVMQPWTYTYHYDFSWPTLPVVTKSRKTLNEEVSLVIVKDSTDHSLSFEAENSGVGVYRLELRLEERQGLTSPDGCFEWAVEVAPATNSQVCRLSWAEPLTYTLVKQLKSVARTASAAPVLKPSPPSSDLRADFTNVPIEFVKLEFLESLLGNSVFCDPYFPLTNYSLYGDRQQDKFDHAVEWRRPSQFLKGKIEIFQGKIEQSDIIQGKLGNCWFMVAACALTGKDQYLRRLFDSQAVQKNGIYRIRLCKNGEWQVVTVDDYIPCYPRGKPLFSKANGPELWVLLLEKAYAKLHGSYLALKAGFASDAFIDLTGCPSYTFNFENEKVKALLNSGQLMTMIREWHNQGYCIVAATDDEVNQEKTGLVSRHYYSISRVAEAYGHFLINLRNPWGEFEWKGRWSDNSRDWSREMVDAVRPNFDADDGAFWMDWQDFTGLFYKVVVSKVKNYCEVRLKNLFVKDSAAGARPSLYYRLVVPQTTQLTLGVHQEDDRAVGVNEYRSYLDIGLAILAEDFTPVAVEYTKTDREVFLETCLNPGSYLVVPLTSGCYLQRPAAAKPKAFPLMTEEGDLHPLFQSTIKDIFRRFDTDISQELGFEEFSSFAARIGQHIDQQTFTEVIKNKYTSTEQGVTLQGLYELFIVGVYDLGEETVRQWIQALGYDTDFYSVESKPVVLTSHSDFPVTLTPLPTTTELITQVWTRLAQAYGKDASSSRSITIKRIDHEVGFTLVAISNSASRQVLQVDMSNSQNTEFSSGANRFNVSVDPHSSAVMQHVMVVKSAPSMRFAFSYESRVV